MFSELSQDDLQKLYPRLSPWGKEAAPAGWTNPRSSRENEVWRKTNNLHERTGVALHFDAIKRAKNRRSKKHKDCQ